MPRFAANLTMMFNEVPFLDRFEAAADFLVFRRLFGGLTGLRRRRKRVVVDRLAA